MDAKTPSIAIIGAGPAGLYAARELANNGFKVALFNRNIKPGGLAEYGIYPEKYRIKDGLRSQFNQILDCENVSYFGNVTIGEKMPLKLADLRKMGFAAILVTCGAQGTKWLGLPGEDLCGVYHAKTLVYYYNHLPPFATMPIKYGRKVVVVGVGNVMTDIVRFMVQQPEVEEITTIARRGPAEVKFDRKELEHIAGYLDMEDFHREIERVAPAMKAIGQDPEIAVAKIRETAGSSEKLSKPTWKIHFLLSPVKLEGIDGNLRSIQMEENTLEIRNGDTKARGTGTMVDTDTDVVVFAIGDRVDDELGLAIQSNEFIKSSVPKYPVDGVSYELTDPVDSSRVKGIFVGGWARNASTGMVGVARRDGSNAAQAVMAYVNDQHSKGAVETDAVEAKLKEGGYRFVKTSDLKNLDKAEKELAQAKGLPEYKFDTNEEMLKIMGL